MECIWFIYYDTSEDKLYIQRSWMGNLIYIVLFKKRDNDTFVATNAVANRDPSQYHCKEDSKEKDTLLRLVKMRLLHDWS